MFRIIDNKINIFGRWVSLESGEHTIHINKSTGTIYTDSVPVGANSVPVVKYNKTSSSEIKIDSLVPKTGESGKFAVLAPGYNSNLVISRGMLYEDPIGVGEPLEVRLEGFLFSFNYYAIANIVSALKPYIWVGGRVCYDTMLYHSNGSLPYTAMPTLMSCGAVGLQVLGDDVASTQKALLGTTNFFNAMGQDAIGYIMNSTSITFSFRTHRKYVFFASNIDGLFETQLGSILGASPTAPPSGSFPDIGGLGFTFTMFSLRN